MGSPAFLSTLYAAFPWAILAIFLLFVFLVVGHAISETSKRGKP